MCDHIFRRVPLGCRDSDAASREELASAARYIFEMAAMNFRGQEVDPWLSDNDNQHYH